MQKTATDLIFWMSGLLDYILCFMFSVRKPTLLKFNSAIFLPVSGNWQQTLPILGSSALMLRVTFQRRCRPRISFAFVSCYPFNFFQRPQFMDIQYIECPFKSLKRPSIIWLALQIIEDAFKKSILFLLNWCKEKNPLILNPSTLFSNIDSFCVTFRDDKSGEHFRARQIFKISKNQKARS